MSNWADHDVRPPERRRIGTLPQQACSMPGNETLFLHVWVLVQLLAVSKNKLGWNLQDDLARMDVLLPPQRFTVSMAEPS